MGKKAKAIGRVGKASRGIRAYPYEFRLQIMRLYLEDRYNTSVLREQFGVSNHSVHRWAKAYRQLGVEGLVFKLRTGAQLMLNEAVNSPVVRVKESHPEYGPQAYRRGSKTLFSGERQRHKRAQNAFRRMPNEKGKAQTR